jgi:hypothetical protein
VTEKICSICKIFCRLCYLRFLPFVFADVSCMKLEITFYYFVFLLVDHVFCQCNKGRRCHCPKNTRFASVLHMSLSISIHTHWHYSTFFIHIVNCNQSHPRSKYRKNWPWLGQFFASCHRGGLILITCHFVCDSCCSVRHWDNFSPIFWCFLHYYSNSVPYSLIYPFLLSFINPYPFNVVYIVSS